MKHLKTLIALVLTLTIVFMIPMQTAAAAENGKYVGEIYLAYGEDAAAAKKVLQNNGFTPVEGNLNENGDTYVMLGYKTTNDVRASITDIAVMNMDGGYSTTEYKEVLRQRKTQVAQLLGGFMSTIQEYRANLKAGRERAKVVHDLLNKFIDDDTGLGLGDLFNRETFQDKVGIMKSVTAENTEKLPDLLTILMQGNLASIQTVESLLALAADPGDDTWVDRFAQKDLDAMLDEIETSRPDLNTETKRMQFLDSEYGTIASGLSTVVAALRAELLDYENLGLDINTATEEQVKATFGDINDADEEKRATAAAEIMEWTETGSIYENLRNFEGGAFAKGELLAWFLEEVDEDETERYFPMAAAFTAGQRGSFEFIPFRNLLRYAFIDDEVWKADVKRFVKLDEIESESIYQNINREIFSTDGSVAYTDSATRRKNVALNDEEDEPVNIARNVTIALWALTAFGGVGMFIQYLLNTSYMDELEEATTGLSEIMAGDPAQYVNGSLTHFFSYVTLFLALAAAISTLYYLSSVEDVTLKPIPKYVVDNYTDGNGESYDINYQAAVCNRADYNHNEKQSGDAADLNADEGKQWLAVYYSKNSKAGNPVLAGFGITSEAKAPAGMNGCIHMIGERGALNLTNDEYMNYTELHSRYKTVIGTADLKTYVFFGLSATPKTYDASAGNMTATTMNTGTMAIFGLGGLALGAILGIVGSALAKKKKKAPAAA